MALMMAGLWDQRSDGPMGTNLGFWMAGMSDDTKVVSSVDLWVGAKAGEMANWMGEQMVAMMVAQKD